MLPTISRQMYSTLEPYHAMIYFVPEARSAYERIGLEDRSMGYFASRGAPLGAVSAEIITAIFYNFHSALVRSVIPEAWQRAAPAQISTTQSWRPHAGGRKFADIKRDHPRGWDSGDSRDS
jgi:hypothetical protein